MSRTRRGTLGAGSNHKKSRVVPGEPPDHALGRSRSGLTSKVHALSDLTYTPGLALRTAGQAGDNPMLAPLDESRVLRAMCVVRALKGCEPKRLRFRRLTRVATLITLPST